MVRVLFTSTLPSRMEQSRKLPIRRSGMIAYGHKIVTSLLVTVNRYRYSLPLLVSDIHVLDSTRNGVTSNN